MGGIGAGEKPVKKEWGGAGDRGCNITPAFSRCTFSLPPFPVSTAAIYCAEVYIYLFSSIWCLKGKRVLR